MARRSAWTRGCRHARPSGRRRGGASTAREWACHQASIEVQAVWFGDRMVSRPYGPHELDGVRGSEDRWCQFLHDNEGVEAMTLNGETVWQSADSRKSTALDDVLDALRG